MLKITKKNEKPIFSEIRRKYTTYAEIRKDEKDMIKEILIEEQNQRCAYCMCRIDLSSTSIEHYIPQSVDPSLSIDYRNMFAVCNITKNNPREHQTCDAHRGNSALHIDPRSKSDIDTIQYTHSGGIKSVKDVFDNDLNAILNLNDERLRNNRMAAMKALADRFNKNKDREWSRKKIESFLSDLKSPDNNTPYSGYLIFILEKRLKRF